MRAASVLSPSRVSGGGHNSTSLNATGITSGHASPIPKLDPAARDRKKFSSLRRGPSDGENQVNHLTLAFMDLWRRRGPRDNSDGGGSDMDAVHDGGLVTPRAGAAGQTGRITSTAAASHRLQVLRFLKSTTQREAQVLDLRGATLNAEDFVYVGVVLANHPTICTVDLRGIVIPPLVARMLITLSQQNRFLTDIFVDETHFCTRDMTALLLSLEANRAFVTQERKRRWVEKEAALYKESVLVFAKLMETFFVNEMRSRHDLEELEWERRTETVLQATAHRRKTLRRQHNRRTVEMVLERLQIVVEREGAFRKTIRIERIKGVVRYAIDLEGSAREALAKEEHRVRAEVKQCETKDWVLARRKEKVRKEFEASQRHDVEVSEAGGRQGLMEEAGSLWRRLEDVASKDRDQVLIAESIRLEKERRDAIQRRKEAEAARERKEREEKERAMQLQRLRTEQRKDRERFEVEAGVARKRIQNDRSVFFKAIEERWVVASSVLASYGAFRAAYDAFHALMVTPLLPVIRGNNTKLLTPQLERDATAAAEEAAASGSANITSTKSRSVAPHISLRLEPPPGWTQHTVTYLGEVRTTLEVFQERAASALVWRHATHHRESINMGALTGSNSDAAEAVPIALRRQLVAAAAAAPQLPPGSPSVSVSYDEDSDTTTPPPGATGGHQVLSSPEAAPALQSPVGKTTSPVVAGTPPLVTFVPSAQSPTTTPPQPGPAAAASQHASSTSVTMSPQQLLVYEWSCEHLQALCASVDRLPMHRLKAVDDVMLWKTNIAAVELVLRVDVSSIVSSAEMSLTFNPQLLVVQAAGGSAVELSAVSETETRAAIQLPTAAGSIRVCQVAGAPRILDALDERYYCGGPNGGSKAQAMSSGLRRLTTFRLSPPVPAVVLPQPPPPQPPDLQLESSPQRQTSSDLTPEATKGGDGTAEASTVWDEDTVPPAVSSIKEKSLTGVVDGVDGPPMLQQEASMSLVRGGAAATAAPLLSTLCILETLRSATLRLSGKRAKKAALPRRSSTAATLLAAAAAVPPVRLELSLSCGDDTARGALAFPTVCEDFF